MQRNSQIVPGNSFQAGIVTFDSLFELGIRIAAALLHSLAKRGIEIVRVIRSIELNVGRSFGCQPLDVVADDVHEIAKEVRIRRIETVGDACLVAGDNEI